MRLNGRMMKDTKIMISIKVFKVVLQNKDHSETTDLQR